MSTSFFCKRLGRTFTEGYWRYNGNRLGLAPIGGRFRFMCEPLKPSFNREFLVDSLALVRRLEGEEMPLKHAEAITSAINEGLENVSQSFVSKEEMQTSTMLQDASISNFRSQVQSSQEHHFSLLQHEIEKMRVDIGKMHSEQRVDIEKMHSELRYEIVLEIHALKEKIEAAKYDAVKYCIGTLVSISAVGLASVRILL